MARPSGASDDAEVVELEAVALAEGEQCVPFIAAGSGAEVGRGGRGRDDIAGEAAGGGRVVEALVEPLDVVDPARFGGVITLVTGLENVN